MSHPIFDQFYIFEVPNADWAHVILNLVERADGVQVGDVQIVQQGRNPLYYLRRICFAEDKVAAALGMTTKELSKRGIIHLPLLDDDSQYPKPTVPYSGRA